MMYKIEEFIRSAKERKHLMLQAREHAEQERRERDARMLLSAATDVFGEIIQAAGFEPRPDSPLGRPHLLASYDARDIFLISRDGWELGVLDDEEEEGLLGTWLLSDGGGEWEPFEPDMSVPDRLALALEEAHNLILRFSDLDWE